MVDEQDDAMFGSSGFDLSESKGAAKRLRFWIAVVCLTVTGSMLGVAVVLGIQNREDHVLTGQITQTEAQLRALGARIADIKDHEFRTMAEYVAAYAKVEPLLTAYDQKLQEYSELYDTAQRRDEEGSIRHTRHAFAPRTRASPVLARGVHASLGPRTCLA